MDNLSHNLERTDAEIKTGRPGNDFATSGIRGFNIGSSITIPLRRERRFGDESLIFRPSFIGFPIDHP
jgi:hypothetical protein